MATTTTTKSVPFFDYKIFATRYQDVLTKTFLDVLNRGAYILQKDLAELEDLMAKYLGAKHAIGVANCTDGLTLALKACDIQSGDEVILPSHTFVATAAAVKAIGASPVLVECGPDHMLDPSVIAKAITNKAKAIMPVQVNGRTCNMDEIMAIANKHNLLVIEDAAQALGSKFKGKYAGTFGIFGAISFYPAKILGCLGDGGLVITNDDAMADKLYCLHDHGRSKQGNMKGWGVNSRLDNLQAAFLMAIFQDYDYIINRRREIAALYQNELGGVAELLLPPAPDSDPNHFDVYQNYEIEAERRDALQIYLKTNGIGTLRQWGGEAVHQIKSLGFNVALPNTEKMMVKELLLPMNISVTNNDIIYICDTIKNFYHKS